MALFETITAASDAESTADFAYQNAERLFRSGKYFEAHEVLEFQWKKESGERKTFFQGIIQLSVSLHKIFVKPNGRGSRMQAERSREKLESLYRSEALSEFGKKETESLLGELDSILGLFEGDEVVPEKLSAFSIPRIPQDWRRLFKVSDNV